MYICMCTSTRFWYDFENTPYAEKKNCLNYNQIILYEIGMLGFGMYEKLAYMKKPL